MKLEYPKTIEENLRFRADLLMKCEADPRTASLVREYTRRDILFFFNVYAWTYDVRTGDKDLPFVTYPFQDEAILEINRWIEDGENGFIDKSRDMGVTYIVLYVFLWRWLSKKSEQFRIGSRKEEYVDKAGDMDTLFEKLRYCLDRLPFWILPRGFDKKKHSTFMRLINPELSCAIIGESTNRDFGRGGRPKAILLDEFETWEKADEAWRAASDATQCKLPVGTPKGSGNKFAELARTDEVKNKLKMMWWKHPKKAVTSQEHIEGPVKTRKLYDKVSGYVVEFGKDQSLAPSGCYVDQHGKIRSEWYDKECEKRDASNIAENLDCSYLTSGNPVFDTLKCDENLRRSVPPKEVGNLIWRIRPMFNEDGICINQDQLSVEFVPNFNGIVKIWEHPHKQWENGYCISADVAEGLEQGDFDSASVLRRFAVGEDDKPRTVASIHTKIRTFEYAEELAKIAVYYNKAIVAVERNNTMGGSTLERLFRIYNRLYHKEIFTRGYAMPTDKLGWETNNGTKGQIIGNLSQMISNNTFVDNDEGFWKETLTYVNDDGKLEAQGKSRGEKCYDDRVMDRAILMWINQQLPLPQRVVPKTNYTGWRTSWNKPQGDLVRFI